MIHRQVGIQMTK